MKTYLERLRFEILYQRETDKQKELDRKKNKHSRDVKKLVRPEGITVKEFFADGFAENSLEDLGNAYEEAWQREKLIYADGYIKLLISIAEYYEKKHRSDSSDDLKRLLDDVFGTFERSNYKKLAARYYIKAASVANSVSLIYFPQQDYPEEAERYLQLAVEFEKKAMRLGVVPEYHSIALNNLGTHYYETNRPKKALPVLKKALEYAKTPDEEGLVLHNLALTYADLGMKKEAVDCMVKSTCIHYAMQHDFGDVSLYDKNIERIIKMTGDTNTDIYALKVALDLVSGNLNAKEAKKLLEQIDHDEWPLTDALLSILNGEECVLSSEIVKCTKLLQDVAKVSWNENALKLQESHPREVKEDLERLKKYVEEKCKNAPILRGIIIDTFDTKTYIKANYGSEECYYLIRSAEVLAFSWFTKRRNWRWRIKGIVWINGKPHILLGKIRDQKLLYALYNIDMSRPKIFNVPAPTDFIGDLWNAWMDNLERALTDHPKTERGKMKVVLF
ncbi:tetratricopeptide repeat protein [Thermococcus sp. 18S1]|nr:tetratricopeptide repeat protein [Thermococcus sp. 18S1]